jgi:hypothetical protein
MAPKQNEFIMQKHSKIDIKDGEFYHKTAICALCLLATLATFFTYMDLFLARKIIPRHRGLIYFMIFASTFSPVIFMLIDTNVLAVGIFVKESVTLAYLPYFAAYNYLEANFLFDMSIICPKFVKKLTLSFIRQFIVVGTVLVMGLCLIYINVKPTIHVLQLVYHALI